MVDWHALLAQFYRVHNPEKVGDVGRILAEYSGREEELFMTLRAKYEPRAVEMDAVGMGFTEAICQTVAPAAVSGREGERELAHYVMATRGIKRRVTRLRVAHPEASEEELLVMAEEDQGAWRNAIARFYRCHAPEKLPDLPQILQECAGEEEALYDLLEMKYLSEAPTPAPPQPCLPISHVSTSAPSVHTQPPPAPDAPSLEHLLSPSSHAAAPAPSVASGNFTAATPDGLSLPAPHGSHASCAPLSIAARSNSAVSQLRKPNSMSLHPSAATPPVNPNSAVSQPASAAPQPSVPQSVNRSSASGLNSAALPMSFQSVSEPADPHNAAASQARSAVPPTPADSQPVNPSSALSQPSSAPQPVNSQSVPQSVGAASQPVNWCSALSLNQSSAAPQPVNVQSAQPVNPNSMVSQPNSAAPQPVSSQSVPQPVNPNSMVSQPNSAAPQPVSSQSVPQPVNPNSAVSQPVSRCSVVSPPNPSSACNPTRAAPQSVHASVPQSVGPASQPVNLYSADTGDPSSVVSPNSAAPQPMHSHCTSQPAHPSSATSQPNSAVTQRASAVPLYSAASQPINLYSAESRPGHTGVPSAAPPASEAMMMAMTSAEGATAPPSKCRSASSAVLWAAPSDAGGTQGPPTAWLSCQEPQEAASYGIMEDCTVATRKRNATFPQGPPPDLLSDGANTASTGDPGCGDGPPDITSPMTPAPYSPPPSCSSMRARQRPAPTFEDSSVMLDDSAPRDSAPPAASTSDPSACVVDASAPTAAAAVSVPEPPSRAAYGRVAYGGVGPPLRAAPSDMLSCRTWGGAADAAPPRPVRSHASSVSWGAAVAVGPPQRAIATPCPPRDDRLDSHLAAGGAGGAEMAPPPRPCADAAVQVDARRGVVVSNAPLTQSMEITDGEIVALDDVPDQLEWSVLVVLEQVERIRSILQAGVVDDAVRAAAADRLGGIKTDAVALRAIFGTHFTEEGGDTQPADEVPRVDLIASPTVTQPPPAAVETPVAEPRAGEWPECVHSPTSISPPHFPPPGAQRPAAAALPSPPVRPAALLSAIDALQRQGVPLPSAHILSSVAAERGAPPL
eukprot:TRINITY_DN4753_c0_g1_i3.p1 TRINITY_DN4753_c0_g1~~TRINITY_DN4753_c0_g1_i3.p1  ORF type:complete len:1075 (+),score=201.47 TRINITY_DN4753_c0_g1_i3:3-3227(+)